ncbi:hypothetical protein BCR43DRAFT_564315 [Syncephalastrum racemosum]|uniref:BHLH domain-containing protein n=1 Tax=Syncephalastrum racemosum TaxID=13706 RepID=A0A1X2H9U0_SYNRA|nr:hypothetical protein BCR43DRAFT_564315 [Syncephalastrum racemosum]
MNFTSTAITNTDATNTSIHASINPTSATAPSDAKFFLSATDTTGSYDDAFKCEPVMYSTGGDALAYPTPTHNPVTAGAAVVDDASRSGQNAQPHNMSMDFAEQLIPEMAYQLTPRSPYACDTPVDASLPYCTSPAPLAVAPNNNPFPCTPTSPTSSSPSPSASSSSSQHFPQHPTNGNQHPAVMLQENNPFPDAFLPDFLQYSKETYESSTAPHANESNGRKKRSHQEMMDPVDEWDYTNTNGAPTPSPTSADENKMSNSEMRRQIHIQSEQKRRAQIKDGFEDLRNELPSCLNKKMSKVALLHRTVQHIQHLKSTQMSILAELERLVAENEQLRKFQESVLQKQALEKMYHINSM